MNEIVWQSALNQLDDSLLDAHMTRRDSLRQAARRRTIRTAWGAAAAAMCVLAVGLLCAGLIRARNGSSGNPGKDNGIVLHADTQPGTADGHIRPAAPDETAVPWIDDLSLTPAVDRQESEGGDAFDTFTDAAALGICTQVYTEKRTDGSVPDSIISPFTSERAEYRYTRYAEAHKDAGEPGRFYCVYDVYGTEREELMLLHGTDLLCQYFFREDTPCAPSRMTPEEAVRTSDEFLRTFLSSAQTAKFGEPTVTAGSDGIFAYTVTYVRRAAGYATDETLTVFLSPSGRAVGYNGMNLGKYDACAESILPERVRETEDALTDKIRAQSLLGCTMKPPVITTDTDGRLYLGIVVNYRDAYGMKVSGTCFMYIKE